MALSVAKLCPYSTDGSSIDRDVRATDVPFMVCLAWSTAETMNSRTISESQRSRKWK